MKAAEELRVLLRKTDVGVAQRRWRGRRLLESVFMPQVIAERSGSRWRGRPARASEQSKTEQRSKTERARLSLSWDTGLCTRLPEVASDVPRSGCVTMGRLFTHGSLRFRGC